MTKYLARALHFVVVGLPIGMVAMPVCAQQTQSVTVTITVQTENGDPLENVPLEIHSPTQARFGFTGANGVHSSPLDITDGDDLIGIWLHPGFRYDPAVHDVALAAQMYTTYREQYYFRKGYFLTIVPGTTVYSLPITAYPVVHITGSVTPPGPQEQWRPDSVTIHPRDGLWFGSVDPINQFSVPVRRGADVELFISMADSSQVHGIVLTAAQTLDDTDVGVVTLPAIQTDGIVEITMQNAQDRWSPGGVGPLWRGVTIIDAGGSDLFRFVARHDDGFVIGNPDSAVDPDLAPELPAGTYYVAPGFVSFGNESMYMKLLDSIRAGQQAQLDAAGVPKFTALAGQTVQVTFDAVQARDAVLSVVE